LHTYQRVSITREECSERWQAIIRALLAHGIDPDITTVVALSLGADALARNLGIDTTTRAIGFVPSEEGR
jgi:hypothetical protein